ncbi:MAG TPA: hypothetical protein VGS12_00800 [Caulobacteraceae bacterium]|nr:hypothetical protein [Caulobacteraceae bacterium]
MSLVLLVPNEPLPRWGRPASGPGLRALNLAVGLQANGHDIVAAVPAVSSRAQDEPDLGAEPLVSGVEEVPIDFGNLVNFIRTRRPDVAIFTNYMNFHHVIASGVRANLGRTKLIYDFFAPRVLENAAGGLLKGKSLEEERQRKMQALRSADGILLNGRKKLGYVTAWLAFSGGGLATPVVETPFCVPVDFAGPPPPQRRAGAGLRLVVSGNRQPWTRSKLQLLDILPTLARFGWTLTQIGKPDFSALQTSGESYLSAIDPDLVSSYDGLDFPTFLQRLSEADLAVDIFETTLEREMAYVTRTAVAMSAGLPVVHPAGTELAEFISRWDCGWTYKNEGEIFGILEWIHANPAEFRRRAVAASELAKTYLNPRHATAAAAQLISELSTPKIRQRAAAARLSAPLEGVEDWFSGLTSVEWLRRRFDIDYFDYQRAASPADLYLGFAERHGYGAPNFVLEHALRRAQGHDMRRISAADASDILARYFDAEWYAETYGISADVFGCAAHYFYNAGRLSVSPSPYFCENLYLSLHPEVGDAIDNHLFINGFHHFLTLGMEKGLPATILFDEQFYLSTNTDVARALPGAEYASGFEHFLRYGRREGRRTSQVFDPTYYKNTYSDLPRGWGPEELRRHFLKYGLGEGRDGSLFHKELRDPLQPPAFGAYSKRARTALAELGGAEESADLGRRFQEHIRKAQSGFADALVKRVEWLRRLRYYQF